jgi:hypothetical protein
MSDQEKSLPETAWEKVLNEITDPWDWIAAGAGAAIGGVVALITHWPDLFTIAATGATAGVTIRKAWAAARRRPQLRRRSRALDKLFEQIQSQADPSPQFPTPNLDPYLLLQALRREITLWEERAISNEQFAQQLDDLVNNYRLITAFLATLKKEGTADRISDTATTHRRGGLEL